MKRYVSSWHMELVKGTAVSYGESNFDAAAEIIWQALKADTNLASEAEKLGYTLDRFACGEGQKNVLLGYVQTIADNIEDSLQKIQSGEFDPLGPEPRLTAEEEAFVQAVKQRIIQIIEENDLEEPIRWIFGHGLHGYPATWKYVEDD